MARPGARQPAALHPGLGGWGGVNFLQGYLSLVVGAGLWVAIFVIRSVTRDEELRRDLRGCLILYTGFIGLRVIDAMLDGYLPPDGERALRVGWMLAFAFGSVRAFVSASLWAFRRVRRGPNSKILRD